MKPKRASEPSVDASAGENSAGENSAGENSAGEDLAVALRALHLKLQETKVSDETLREAAVAIRSVTATIDGETRLRWYEMPDHIRDRESPYREHTLFHGTQSPLAIPLIVEEEQRPDGKLGLVGRVTVNRLFEGPPMTVHGGYLAGLFDAILGDSQRLVDGDPAMTGVLEIRYRHRTPLDKPLLFRSWIESDRGRRLLINASCEVDDGGTSSGGSGSGIVTAEAKGFFVRVSTDALRKGS